MCTIMLCLCLNLRQFGLVSQLFFCLCKHGRFVCGVVFVDLMRAYVFLQSTKAHHAESKNDVIY